MRRSMRIQSLRRINPLLDIRGSLFGPGHYLDNVDSIKRGKPFLNNQQLYSEPNTAESISAIARDMDNLQEIFSRPKGSYTGRIWLGRIVRTQEGVFVNPPYDSSGNTITDESTLKKLLRVKHLGVYFGMNGLGFAPHSSFKEKDQDVAEFVRGGLAQVLERSFQVDGATHKLEKISSEVNRPVVNVNLPLDFLKPRVVALDVSVPRYGHFDRLNIDGDFSVHGGWGAGVNTSPECPGSSKGYTYGIPTIEYS